MRIIPLVVKIRTTVAVLPAVNARLIPTLSTVFNFPAFIWVTFLAKNRGGSIIVKGKYYNDLAFCGWGKGKVFKLNELMFL